MEYPDVVAEMRDRYEQWVATLAPVIPLGKGKGESGGRVPHGYGWATDKDAEPYRKS